jgi:hypothetical protein
MKYRVPVHQIKHVMYKEESFPFPNMNFIEVVSFRQNGGGEFLLFAGCS